MLFLLGALLSAGFVNAQTTPTTVFGLNAANQIVRFNSATPGTVTVVATITGLQTGETILATDFRPANGQLYALGSSSRLYTINLTTGAATQVGAAGAFTLSGTEFGFDFNPVVDLIRVISNTGQNLRINPNNGTLTATDTTLNPATTGATGAAYTNNFAGATTTTLYVIDTVADALFIQNPPNAGTLVRVGALGVDASGPVAFDIDANGTAYATFTVGGTTRLYTINLTTGAATAATAFPAGTSLRGLAIARGTAATNNMALDYDGDRRADFAVIRFSNNTYYVNRSSNNTFFAAQFGFAGSDVPQPGDYDGDGRADIAVWRPSNGTFIVLRSSDNAVQFFRFGLNGDEPVARDYDGDGRTDFAVVRRANGLMTWFITNSSNGGFRAEQFGLDTDVTAPGDYDGDGRFDLAVYRGTAGQQATFFVQQSTSGFRAVQFGLGSDLVVPGDYDGDGRTDFAVVRLGAPYQWFILRSSDNSLFYVPDFGTKPHLTAQGDYDGDGRTDIAVFDPGSGNFIFRRSSDSGITYFRFGQNGDYPVANYDTH
ncbi:MAG TPA: DUF4394 domain-containing protein [Pyrinomonadaceae bacterium]|jgi:hypothetical protein